MRGLGTGQSSVTLLSVCARGNELEGESCQLETWCPALMPPTRFWAAHASPGPFLTSKNKGRGSSWLGSFEN